MKRNVCTAVYLLTFFCLIACTQRQENDRIPLNEIRGTYEPQLNYLNEAIEDDPTNNDLLYKRARVYHNMYQYAVALKDIQEAIRYKSNKGDYYLLLAQIHFAMGNHFEAIKASEKAESLGLNDPELPMLQARIYWATDDTTRSFFYRNKVEQIAPFHSDIQLLKAQQSALHRDTISAITFLLKAIKRDHKNLNAYSELIKMYLSKSKEDSALYYVIKAREFNPNSPDFYYSEARIYQKKDLRQSAIISYLYCLREDSAYVPAMVALGQLYQKEGQPVEAVTYYQKYVTFQNDDKEVYKNLIALLTEQGKEEATIPYYERLIQLDTLNTSFKLSLQRLYKQYIVDKVAAKDTVAAPPAVVAAPPAPSVQERPAVPANPNPAPTPARRVEPRPDTIAGRTTPTGGSTPARRDSAAPAAGHRVLNDSVGVE